MFGKVSEPFPLRLCNLASIVSLDPSSDSSGGFLELLMLL